MKILFISFDHIGDVVRLTAMLANLRLIYPNAFITVLLKPLTSPILDNSPLDDEVIVFDYEKFKDESKTIEEIVLKNIYPLLGALKTVQYDLVINLCSDIGAIIAGYIEPKKVLGRISINFGDYQTIGEEATKFFNLMRDINGLRVYAKENFIESSLKVLLDLGINSEELKIKKPVLHISKKDNKFADEFRQKYKGEILLGVHPSSSDIRRIYPYKKLANVLNVLDKKEKLRIIIFGSADEKNIIDEELKPYLDFEAIVLAGQTTLLESAGIISKLNLFLCVDSGLMHIASAFDIPIIALFARHACIIQEAKPSVSELSVLEEDEIHQIKEEDIIDKVSLFIKKVFPSP